MTDTKALREQRAKLVKDAQALANKPDATAEDQANANRMLDEADAMLARIETLERADKAALSAGIDAGLRENPAAGREALTFNAERELEIFAQIVNARTPLDRLAPADQDYAKASIARELRILRAVSLKGLGGLTEADQAHYASRFGQVVAAGASVPDTAGGYTIAPLFEATLLIAMKLQGGMREAARVIQTATGAALPYPTLDDTAVKATILGTENTDVGTAPDLSFGKRQLGAFTYVSGVLKMPLQLLQDSAFDFGSLITNAFTGRFQRGQNAHFTTGTGNGQPRGMITAADVGWTTAGGQVNTLIYDDFVELEHSVDPVYRPGASWMMADATKKIVRKLKDSQGHPLWEPSLTAGTPDSLLRYPIRINQDMATPAAGAVTVGFGDFSNYVIRDTLGLQVAVLRELFATSLQVGWSAYMRSDGDLLSAAKPIKTIKQAAS